MRRSAPTLLFDAFLFGAGAVMATLGNAVLLWVGILMMLGSLGIAAWIYWPKKLVWPQPATIAPFAKILGLTALRKALMPVVAVFAVVLLCGVFYWAVKGAKESSNWVISHPSMSDEEQEIAKAECRMEAMNSVSRLDKHEYINTCLISRGFVREQRGNANKPRLSSEKENSAVGDVVVVRSVTQEEYDSLTHKDDNILYIIKPNGIIEPSGEN